MLNPLPSDDESLLGRVLDRQPAAGQSLEEVARPNPCADKLTEAKTLPSVATFDDAEELAVGGKASATLGTYGFSGDASRATHFVYKLETEKRASRVDTAEYEACCKEKACGYGFVSALVYGSGEYATAEETSGSAGVSVVFVAKVEGTATLKILHKRTVRGWVAALIRVTDQSKAPSATVGALGDPSAYGIKLDASTLPEQVRGRYDAAHVEVVGPPLAYAFKQGVTEVSENDFITQYRSVVGASELDSVEGSRKKVPLFLSGIVILASGTLAAFGTYAAATAPHTSGQPSNQFSFGLLGAVFGGVGVLFGTVWFVSTVVKDDDPHDHRITKFDAELYVQHYNRALLRKTVKEADERIRALQGRAEEPRRDFSLRVSPLGVAGTF